MLSLFLSQLFIAHKVSYYPLKEKVSESIWLLDSDRNRRHVVDLYDSVLACRYGYVTGPGSLCVGVSGAPCNKSPPCLSDLPGSLAGMAACSFRWSVTLRQGSTRLHCLANPSHCNNGPEQITLAERTRELHLWRISSTVGVISGS